MRNIGLPSLLAGVNIIMSKNLALGRAIWMELLQRLTY